jgi:hypothetical protein
MNVSAVRRIIPVSKTRRRVLLHLFAAVVVLTALIPRGQPAQADVISGCFQTFSGSETVCAFPPHDLLNLDQPLYAATDAQRQSLQTLETKAVSNVLADHGLPPSDNDAAQSWGRYDAEAELFGLLEQAITTTASARTTDQQNAVDWIAAVEGRQAEVAAQNAGLEYVKWAGLDPNSYQSLLNNNASQSDLQTFLSTTPEPFNGTGFGDSSRGFCVYRPPAPYSTEYNDSKDPLCYTSGGLGCLFNCLPPTPSYDQFTKWGEDDANNALLSSGGYAQTAGDIAAGLIFGSTVVGAGVSGVALSSGLAEALIGTTLQQTILPYAGYINTALEEGVAEEAEDALDVAFASSEIAASAGTIVTVLIAAITAAVVEGINVTNAGALPGKLATLIVDDRTATPDPAALLNDVNGTTSLYSLFVDATLPAPSPQSCDNGSHQQGLIIDGQVITETVGGGNCLNATPIPPASSGDLTFGLRWNLGRNGFANSATASTITLVDSGLGITQTARLSGNWFITQPSGGTAWAQTLSIVYTDWKRGGDEQIVWLLGNPTGGYRFVGYDQTLANNDAQNAGVNEIPFDPATCLARSICWTNSFIDYVGSDGNDYQATVHSPNASTGAPTYGDFGSFLKANAPTFNASEGEPVVFFANGFAPQGASGQVDYTWEFQQTACNIDCLAQTGVDYTAPVDDPGGVLSESTDIRYTWPTSGLYSVRLTATDATGAQAVDTFTVNVADIPPYFSYMNVNNGFTTGDVGYSLFLDGVVGHFGSQDDEIVSVNWGDGTTTERWDAGPHAFDINAPEYFTPPPLTLTTDASTGDVDFSDTHTYATAGIYYGTVSVADQSGGTASQTFRVEILNPPPTTSGLAPTSASIGSSPTLTVTGRDFVPGATVAFDGTPLATTFVSATTLTAQVPATDTASAAVGLITVLNPAPVDGGDAATVPQPLYITPAQNPLVAANVATSLAYDGNATAAVGGSGAGSLSAAAVQGRGTVAVAQYSADPVTTTPPTAVNAYFDVFVSVGSTFPFESVQVTDCKLGGGSVVYYYDDTSGQWIPVSGQSYDAASGCVSFTLNAGSTPSLTQLSGTDFGVGHVPPSLTLPAAPSVPYHDALSLSLSAADPVPSAPITLAVTGLPGGLSFTDNGHGTGTISGTVTAAPGTYPLTVTAGDGVGSTTQPLTITVTKEDTTLAYTGTSPIANSRPATLSAVLKEDGSSAPAPAGQAITLTLGSGSSAQSCQGTTKADGTVSCQIATVTQPLGSQPVSASFAGDSDYAASSDSSQQRLVFSYLPAGGGFALGDKAVAAATSGTTLTWWGSQWATLNPLSGGAAPSSFKGFAQTFASGTTAVTDPVCGGTWTTTTGGSATPPSTVPAYMAVVVPSKVTQSGTTTVKISGTIAKIVIVKTNPGYQPDPTHPGTGTMVATLCGS